MVPRVSMRLWPIFVRDPWSCAKHFVSAVPRRMPSLSFLLTKLLHPSPSKVKLPDPPQYKSLGDLAPPTFPAPHSHLPLHTPDTLSFFVPQTFPPLSHPRAFASFLPGIRPLPVNSSCPWAPAQMLLLLRSFPRTPNSEEGMDPVPCIQNAVPQKCIVGHVPRPSCPRDSRSAQHAINTGKKGRGSQVALLPRLQVFNHPPVAFNFFF